MKVKATAAMAKSIKEETGFNASLIKLNIEEYKIQVDTNIFSHEIDWNDKENKMQVIKITYPASCYAMPRYLTTKDLHRCFVDSDKTYAGFFKAVENAIEI